MVDWPGQSILIFHNRRRLRIPSAALYQESGIRAQVSGMAACPHPASADHARPGLRQGPDA